MTGARQALPRGRLARLTRGVAWSVALGLALYGADRALLGPRHVGWLHVETLEAIPEEAGSVLIPSNLPEVFVWPPVEVLYRADGERRGFWLGIRTPDSAGPQLWIGSGADPPPEVMGAAAACLNADTHDECPSGWHQLSMRKADGAVVYVLAATAREEMAFILAGLRPPRPTM